MKRLTLFLAVFVWSACLCTPEGLFAQRNARKYSLTVLNLATGSEMLTDGDARVLTERLTSEISAAGLFFTMMQDNMERGLLLKNIDPYGCNSVSCAIKAGRALDVQLVVFGSIKENNSNYILETKMIHVSSREIVKSLRREYADDLSSVYDDLPDFSLELLGLGTVKSTEAAVENTVVDMAPVQESEQSSPVQEKEDYQNDTDGGGFKWKYVGYGLLLFGGVGAGLLIASGGDSGGLNGGNNNGGTTVAGDLPGPPTFP